MWLRVASRSHLLRPFLPPVENGDDLEAVASHPVRDDKWRCGDDQFSGAGDAARTSQIGQFREPLDPLRAARRRFGWRRPGCRGRCTRADASNARWLAATRRWSHARRLSFTLAAPRTEPVCNVLVRNAPALIELLDAALNFIQLPAFRLDEGGNCFSGAEVDDSCGSDVNVWVAFAVSSALEAA